MFNAEIIRFCGVKKTYFDLFFQVAENCQKGEKCKLEPFAVVLTDCFNCFNML